MIVLIQTISVVKAATNLKDRMQIVRKMNIPARHLLLNGRGWRCEGIFSDHRSSGLLLRPLQLCYLTLFPLLFYPLTLWPQSLWPWDASWQWTQQDSAPTVVCCKHLAHSFIATSTAKLLVPQNVLNFVKFYMIYFVLLRESLKNIARGTTDPEIDSVTSIRFSNNMAPLAFVANLSNIWRHLQ